MKKLLSLLYNKLLSNSILPSINPEFFKNNPGTIPLILLFGIAGYLTSQFANSSNHRVDDCIEARKQDAINSGTQILYLEEELKRKDSLYSDLQQQLLIKNGIIEKVGPKLDTLSKKKRRKK